LSPSLYIAYGATLNIAAISVSLYRMFGYGVLLIQIVMRRFPSGIVNDSVLFFPYLQ